MYRRLDVAPDASPEQIGRAYRRLAHSLHPDTHPDDPDAATRFREVTEAYEILSDRARRARYDRNRQPLPTTYLAPSGPAANRDSIEVKPVHPPGQPGQPMFIGLGSFRAGSAPLIAGPVHVAPLATPEGGAPGGSTGSELAQLVEAVVRAWRCW